MQKICLDTCAFFSMIEYNEIHNAGGRQALDRALEQDGAEIEQFKQSILAAMDSKFLKDNAKLSFEEQLDLYKDYATNMLKMAEMKIEIYKKNAEGVFYDKDGKEFRLDIPQSKRDILLKKVQIFENIHAEISKSYQFYLQAREDYKLLVQNHQMGIIYRDGLEGKYEFYITPTVYAEIQNHVAEEDSASRKGNVKYEQRKIDSLMNKHCTLLDLSAAADKVDQLAKEFRTYKRENAKEMAPDINSLGMYGDSTLMAEASLAGIILITLNKKDFISDKSLKIDNDHIRRHIALVEAENYPFATDALPFTPEELLEGRAIEPALPSLYRQPQVFQEAADCDFIAAE